MFVNAFGTGYEMAGLNQTPDYGQRVIGKHVHNSSVIAFFALPSYADLSHISHFRPARARRQAPEVLGRPFKRQNISLERQQLCLS